MSLKGITKATLQIVSQGHYTAPSGARRDIARAQRAARHGTTLLTPDALAALLDDDPTPIPSPRPPHIEVREGKTQAVARALVQDEGLDQLALLSFASARHPGGGFLNGARAQEEDLARCSGLYECLLTQPDYYAHNRAQDSMLYTDHIIYTPALPFFRADNRDLLEQPYLASVLTAPAPNAGQHLMRHPEGHADIEHALRHRAGLVLAAAQSRGYRHLLLGAWGCGVFMNDPAMVADAFGAWLEHARFQGAFDTVVFAIHDTSRQGDTLRPFQARFPSLPQRTPSGDA